MAVPKRGAGLKATRHCHWPLSYRPLSPRCTSADMQIFVLGPGDVPVLQSALLCASDREPALDIEDLPAAVATELSTLADPIATLFGPPAATIAAVAASPAAAGAASSPSSGSSSSTTASGSDSLAGFDMLSPSGLRVPRLASTMPTMTPSARAAECAAAHALVDCAAKMAAASAYQGTSGCLAPGSIAATFCCNKIASLRVSRRPCSCPRRVEVHVGRRAGTGVPPRAAEPVAVQRRDGAYPDQWLWKPAVV